MIKEQYSNEQLPNELSSVFTELQVSKHLRQAGIRKSFGFSCTYLFQLVFCLIFHQKNWFNLFISKKNDCYPGKDTVYRFLYHSKFAWRKFLLHFSEATIQKVSILTSKNRPKVLIIDDSTFDRNRSKNVELLARCFDHASLKMRFYKGFRMFILGWSDGHTFMPIDFSLLSSKTSTINGMNEKIEKRCSGYKRSTEALQSAPNQIPAMIDRALSNGIEASYVLMDTWFTQQPLIQAIVEQGLDVIGMVKNAKQRYNVNGQRLSLKQLYRSATPLQGKKGLRHTDERTLGGLFYDLCDEVNELDWAVALQQLIELLQDVLKKTNKQTQQLLNNQLSQWVAGLPSYIRAYLPNLVCES
ncbi:IS4 family transposase [Metabacillus arenae]|uniref:Transposase n=1 Tax=Metabacillus arenae TaxID=2771434 RepID=A0A926NDR2_9BACI|nr:transposase [Metabacillus arenae]MBD1382387.1 transposase [Metabacillus arenae]